MAATGFAVDLDTMFRASVQFLDTKQFVFDIEAGTVGDLAPSKGMAGNDDVAHTFASKYEPAARTVVQAIDKGGQAMAAISARLLTMSWNYLKNEDSIAASFHGGTIDSTSGLRQPREDCDPTNAYLALPQVTGASASTDIPVISGFWPQGDPARLRAAAAVWTKAAELVDTAQINARNQCAPIFQTSHGSAIDAFRSYLGQVISDHPSGGTTVTSGQPLLENVSAGCRLLAKACDGYADAIDNQRNALRNLAIAAGVITAAGIILTIFTLGLSDDAAAAGDAALAGEAATAADAFATAEAGSEAAAAVAEAERIIAAAADALKVDVAPVAATAAGAAVTLAATTPANAQAVGVGPIPPPVPPVFPLYSPAQQTAAAAWAAGLPHRAANYGNPADQAYQLRIAGPTEYQMPGANGQTVWADGYRPADGAIIDAKHVRQQGCSPRTLDGLQQGNRITQFLSPGDANELGRYQGAIGNPNNHAQYLEIDTDDPETVGYWQFLAAQQHVTSNVRYVP